MARTKKKENKKNATPKKVQAPGRRVPKKYLTENADLSPRLFRLMKKEKLRIIYFDVCDGLLTAHLSEDKSETFEFSIKKLMDYLPPSIFLRVERPYVVNKRFITDLKNFACGWMLYLGEKIKLPMWEKVRKPVEKSKMENAARQYLKQRFATCQPNNKKD
jgi:DNA-binding LytR/AlgR family response regulator